MESTDLVRHGYVSLEDLEAMDAVIAKGMQGIMSTVAHTLRNKAEFEDEPDKDLFETELKDWVGRTFVAYLDIVAPRGYR